MTCITRRPPVGQGQKLGDGGGEGAPHFQVNPGGSAPGCAGHSGSTEMNLTPPSGDQPHEWVRFKRESLWPQAAGE